MNTIEGNNIITNDKEVIRISDAIIAKRTAEIKKNGERHKPKLIAYLGGRELCAIHEVTQTGVFLQAQIVRVAAEEHLHVVTSQ